MNSPEDYFNNFQETNKAGLTKVINSLEAKKSTGYDGVSNFLIKKTCNVIAHLVTLFNACFKQFTFPANYKIAKVIPLFKGGDKENVNCYRPISLLPAFGKLLEKLMFQQTIDYLDNPGMIIFRGFPRFRVN